MSFQSINPTTGELVASFPSTPPDEIEHIVERARSSFREWRSLSLAERAVPMRHAAELLRARTVELGRLMALEVGKPILQGEAEIQKCAWVLEYYAEHAARMLGMEFRPSDAVRSLVRFDPLGVVLAIMPWNFPFWQVFRFLAPALMAGNAALVKHAPSTPQCALAIVELMSDAGFPEGLVGNLFIEPEDVARLIADARVQGVTLTGSDRAGSQVAGVAGRALKKTVLELGGSDPFIVLEDADVDQAAHMAAESRLINSGQSCIAAKRFLVVEAVADRFVEGLIAEMTSRRVGDPFLRETQVGPLARADLRANLHRQVEESVARGAHLLLGGELLAGPGFFYPPSVLYGTRPGMPVWDEEIFGPVATVMPVRDGDEAVRLANQSPYGLGASVWTADRARGEQMAERLEVGCVFVNGLVRSDPRLPFGGIKRSGYGRELGLEGIREFVNVKSVWVA